MKSQLPPVPTGLGRRHLARFLPTRVPHRFTDVVVIGSGVAGLSAALAASSTGEVEVLLVGKAALEESATNYAQGGVAAVLCPEETGDSAEKHVEDTLVAAAGLADESAVRVTVTEGATRVRELIDLGIELDWGPSGSPRFTREGGHSFARIVHRGDTTGRAVEDALLRAVRVRKHVLPIDHAFAVDLLTSNGTCQGVLLHRRHGELEAVWARQTILASGGAGRLYRETTNPAVCTGDGVAMAFRAGAILQDLEFVQFHPTTLYLAGTERFLITEAARGEGGVLRDGSGRAFMEGLHPLKDLAPRDVVSRATVRVMKERGENSVWLDLSGIPETRIQDRFPHILEMCKGFGIDIRREPIPVRPSAHYSIGGVKTDLDGRTSVDGLWAAGEVACTGLHGANRLASNSILEGLVFGHRCGLLAAEVASRTTLSAPILDSRSAGRPAPSRPREDAVTEATPAAEFNREDLLSSLRSLMSYRVAVERCGHDLAATLEQIASWIPYGLGADFHDPQSWSLQNMLQTAYLITYAALRREESRGVHYRSDFPAPDDSRWKRHQLLSRADLCG